MRGRRAFGGCGRQPAAAVRCSGLSSSAGGAIEDDTAWLQAKPRRRGGTIFLRVCRTASASATRGLWVPHDDRPTVTSDGACVVAPRPWRRSHSKRDGTFVTANAVFFVDHSDLRKPLPVRIAISGLHITVPAGKRTYGISVLGHEVTLTSLSIDGSPLTDVRIGAGAKGSRRNERPGCSDGLDSCPAGCATSCPCSGR